MQQLEIRLIHMLSTYAIIIFCKNRHINSIIQLNQLYAYTEKGLTKSIVEPTQRRNWSNEIWQLRQK